MSLKLCDDVVSHILGHASEHTPTEIHAQLVARGYKRLSLSAVKQCLRLNGHAIEDDASSDPSLSTHVEQVMNKPWDAEADTYAFDKYFLGKSVHQIWVQLRGRGYAVTEAEVVDSLKAQNVQSASMAE